jgi:ABC-2 type transport system ATP-binding protein
MIATVRARGLVKRYRTVTAVAGLDAEVRRGECLALLGPNGAGKTTTLRMLLGLLAPDAGQVQWDLGQPAGAPPPRERVGYLPEERGLFREVSILRSVAYFGVLRGMGRAEAQREAARWLDRFELGDRATEKPDALSKGNQQKVQLAATLLHRPDLVVLDEPFSGLDPLNQELVLGLLEELRARGAALVLSAHQLDLVERAADRVQVIARGRERLAGGVAELGARAGRGQRLEVSLRDGAAVAPLAGHPDVLATESLGAGRFRLELRPDIPLERVLAALAAQTPLAEVSSARRSLHSLYLEAVESAADEDTRGEVA